METENSKKMSTDRLNPSQIKHNLESPETKANTEEKNSPHLLYEESKEQSFNPIRGNLYLTPLKLGNIDGKERCMIAR